MKIGEVSKLFDIPVETIRFYESQKIMQPLREAENKYRVYETWDIFFLMECLKYKSYGLSIKDVAKVIHAESFEFFLDKLDDCKNQLAENIRYNTLVNEKIIQYHASLEAAAWNVGNFWIKRLPEQLYFYYVISYGDQYDDIDASKPLFKSWIKALPFVEYADHIEIDDLYSNKADTTHRWSLIIEKKMADMLEIPIDDEKVFSVPDRLYLCSIIDAGEKGELTADQYMPILEYIKNNRYEVCGDIISKLLVRIHKEKKLSRYFEVQVPIIKK